VVNDGTAVELGLKFRSDMDGYISGVRFYKGGAANGGEHSGRLWTSNGTLLGTVTFASETASGWQQALFQNPIPVTANTTYVVSYFAPQGNYAADRNYFASSGVDNGPLRALSNSSAGGNGVYRYGPTGGFPTDTFQSSNYWVDVVFTTTTAPDTTAPTVTSFSPAAGANNVNAAANMTVTFSEAIDAASVNGSTVELRDPANALAPATVSYNAASFTATLDPTASLAAGVTYTARVRGGSADPRVKDLAGNALAANLTWTFTTAAESPATNYSIWAPTATPTNPLENDGDTVELGVKFRSDIDGVITGVRFYKGGPANGGTHVGHLWTSSGTLLGSVTFASETASGWQQALFPTPIPVTANTTYVVSYFAPQGSYAADLNYFASSGVDNGPLRALSNALAGGNGLYRYGPTGGFPTNTYQSSNYWVDVVFIAPGPP
jgi:methionine-rich copper-binding protein CopC